MTPSDPAHGDVGSPPRREREFTDLGFGSVVARQARGRFLSHEGEPTGRKYRLGRQRLGRACVAALAPGADGAGRGLQ